MNDAGLGEAAVLAIAASPDGVRALLADGQLVVGRPT